MRVSVVAGGGLSPGQLSAWSELQLARPEFASPYFRPEFTQAIASVRDDVYVGVLEEGGAPVGFFPFQRSRWGIGQPVGGIICDFQGAIVRAGVWWDAAQLVRDCGLIAWDFHHLLVSQTSFRPFHRRLAQSPYLDLSRGFDAYAQARRAAGSKAIRDVQRKSRKLEREIGRLRFEAEAPEPAVLGTLIRWKSLQYRRTAKDDLFSIPWAREAIQVIARTRAPFFAGMVSALFAGDRLVAAHFGMRSRDAWHYWYPAYDPEFARYSPGLILLLKMAQEGASRGLRLLDLGKGEEEYKTVLASGSVEVAKGSVQSPSLATLRFLPRLAAGAVRWVRRCLA